MLDHDRHLIALRRAEPVVAHGRYAPVPDSDPRLWVSTREAGDDRLLVVCDFSTERLIGTCPAGDIGADLRPHEGRMHRLAAARSSDRAGPVGAGHPAA